MSIFNRFKKDKPVETVEPDKLTVLKEQNSYLVKEQAELEAKLEKYRNDTLVAVNKLITQEKILDAKCTEMLGGLGVNKIYNDEGKGNYKYE